jgi:hypothetical protein
MSRSLKQLIAGYTSVKRPRSHRTVTVDRRFRPDSAVEPLEERKLPAILFQPQFGVEGSNGNHGVLNNVPVYLIYWGSHWQQPAAGNPTSTQVTQALEGLLDTPYFTGLQQYGVDGKAHIAGVYFDTSNPGPSGFSTDDLQNVIENVPNLPESDDLPNLPVYVVLTEPGVSVKNVANAASYNSDGHDYDFPFDYDQVPQIWLGGNAPNGFPSDGSVLDMYVTNFSHEMSEAITDIDGNGPTFTKGSSWVAQPKEGNQISDREAQLHTARLQNPLGTNFLVQSIWSVRDQQYLIADGNVQTFLVDKNGVLTVNDDQLGSKDDTIDVSTSAAGGVAVTLNNETVQFDPGEITGIVVQCHTGRDTVNVTGSASGIPLDIFAGHDILTVNVAPFGKDLSAIQGQVTIHGNGSTTLTLDDGEGAGNQPFTYSVSGGTVTRTSMGTVAYSGVKSLELDGAGGRQTINVENPAAAATQIVAGPYLTQVNVDPSTQDLDAISSLSIDSPAGLVDLAVFDQNNPHVDQGVTTTYTVSNDHVSSSAPAGNSGSHRAPVTITYADLHSLVLSTGTSSTNLVNVEGTPAPTTIHGGSVANTFNVAPTSQNLDAIVGTLTLDGGSAGATVTVNDQADPWKSLRNLATTYAFTLNGNDMLTRDSIDQTNARGDHHGAVISLMGKVNALTLNAGNAANVINVEDCPEGTTINGGTGTNAVNVSPTAHNLDHIGFLDVAGFLGTTSLTVNDQANSSRSALSPSATVYTLAGNTLERDTADPPTFLRLPRVTHRVSLIHVDGVHDLTLNTDNLSNQINVANSLAGSTVINAGSHGDTITVGSSSFGLAEVDGLTIHANGGNVILDDSGVIYQSLAENDDPTHQVAFTVSDQAVTRTDHIHDEYTPDDGNSGDFPDGRPRPHTRPKPIVIDTTSTEVIHYSGAHHLEIDGGPVSTTFAVQSTPLGTPVAVVAHNDNAGLFTVGNAGSVKGIHSALSLTGVSAGSSLLVDDSAAATADQVTMNATQIGAAAADAFFGAGGSLTYTGLGSVAVNLSNAFDDVVNLTPAAGTAFTLTGNPSAFQAGHGASLNLNLTGVTSPVNVPSTPGAGRWTFGNRQAVSYAGFAVPVHDVTAQLAISMGSIVLDPATRHYKQTVTLRNTSTSAIVGPLSLALDGLTPGVRLVNRTGVTLRQGTAGSSYVDVALTNNVLGVGTSVSVTLMFDSPSAVVSYHARALAGTGPR